MSKRRRAGMLIERQLPGFDGIPPAPPPPPPAVSGASSDGAALPSPTGNGFDDEKYPSLSDSGIWTAGKICSVVVPTALFLGVIIVFLFLNNKRRRLAQEERKRTDALWSQRGGGSAGGKGLERKESTDSLIAYVEKRESTLPPRARFAGSTMSFASSMDSLAIDDRRDSRYRPQSFTPSPSMTVRSDPFSDGASSGGGGAVGEAMLSTPRSDYTINDTAASPHVSPSKAPLHLEH